MPLTVRRGDRTFEATVTPRRVPRYEMGDSAGLLPSVRPQVIRGRSRAARRRRPGFRPGDEIRAVDGRPIADSRRSWTPHREQAGQRVDVAGGARRPARVVVPVVPQRRGRRRQDRRGHRLLPALRPGPRRGRERALQRARSSRETFHILGKIFTPRGVAQGGAGRPDRDRPPERRRRRAGASSTCSS